MAQLIKLKNYISRYERYQSWFSEKKKSRFTNEESTIKSRPCPIKALSNNLGKASGMGGGDRSVCNGLGRIKYIG